MKLSETKTIKEDITDHLDNLEQKIFKKKELNQTMSNALSTWKLPKTITIDKFVQKLTKIKLKEIVLSSPYYEKTYTRYSWGEKVAIYQLCLSIKPHSYFSHFTAMFFHGLTNQMPKTIYVNSEQSKKTITNNELAQERIDAAFKRKSRTSKYIFTYKDWKISLLNGKNTNNLGVEKFKISDIETLFMTNIERTLIDIAVRPVYSGGVGEVQKAYLKGKGNISVKALVEMLKKINYIYPYHQAIGFYMQEAGFKDSDLSVLKNMGIKYDFYLNHEMKNKNYSKEWKLFYPKKF